MAKNTIFYEDNFGKLYCGDSKTVLESMKQKVDMCITSPPYWALRNYHVEGQLGQEPSFKDYVKHLCDVFDPLLSKVLKDNGTLWVNLGDTYYGSSKGSGGHNSIQDNNKGSFFTINKNNKGSNLDNAKEFKKLKELPTKSLCMIPARFAIEMQDRGWILRNTVIWHKPNKFPESVTDRFTVDFEYLFMFSKQPRYYFKQQKEPAKESSIKRMNYEWNGSTDEGVAWSGNKKYMGSEKGKAAIKKGRNKRSVWSINTESKRGLNHYACVSEDTEILTESGWKNYKNLIPKESVASYNLLSKRIEYQTLQYVKEYDCSSIMKIGNRDIDILVTHNHRNVILNTRTKKESIVEASNLTSNHKILVNPGVVDYPERKSIGKEMAELLGWIIAEGSISKGGYISLYQNVGSKADRIDSLLSDLNIPVSSKIRRGNQKSWYILKSKMRDDILKLIPNKLLNMNLAALPIDELYYLFNGLVLGDGHIRKDDKRITFIQYNKQNRDIFQIIALRLGYHSINDGKSRVYLTKRSHIGIRRTNGKGKSLKIIKYNKKVWCPKTENGTWVARRNGRVFITGNTYPKELIRVPILAGCRKGGIVLDPFMGTGTSAIVAESQGKRWVGIELNEEYCAVAQNRILSERSNGDKN